MCKSWQAQAAVLPTSRSGKHYKMKDGFSPGKATQGSAQEAHSRKPHPQVRTDLDLSSQLRTACPHTPSLQQESQPLPLTISLFSEWNRAVEKAAQGHACRTLGKRFDTRIPPEPGGELENSHFKQWPVHTSLYMRLCVRSRTGAQDIQGAESFRSFP